MVVTPVQRGPKGATGPPGAAGANGSSGVVTATGLATYDAANKSIGVPVQTLGTVLAADGDGGGRSINNVNVAANAILANSIGLENGGPLTFGPGVVAQSDNAGGIGLGGANLTGVGTLAATGISSDSSGRVRLGNQTGNGHLAVDAVGATITSNASLALANNILWGGNPNDYSTVMQRGANYPNDRWIIQSNAGVQINANHTAYGVAPSGSTVATFGTGSDLSSAFYGPLAAPSLNVSGGATVGGGILYLGTNGNNSGRIYSLDPNGYGPVAIDSANGAAIGGLSFYAGGTVIGNNGITLNTGNTFPLYIRGNTNSSAPIVLGDTATTRTDDSVDVAKPMFLRSSLSVGNGGTVLGADGSVAFGGGIVWQNLSVTQLSYDVNFKGISGGTGRNYHFGTSADNTRVTINAADDGSTTLQVGGTLQATGATFSGANSSIVSLATDSNVPRIVHKVSNVYAGQLASTADSTSIQDNRGLPLIFGAISTTHTGNVTVVANPLVCDGPLNLPAINPSTTAGTVDQQLSRNASNGRLIVWYASAANGYPSLSWQPAV